MQLTTLGMMTWSVTRQMYNSLGKLQAHQSARKDSWSQPPAHKITLVINEDKHQIQGLAWALIFSWNIK